MTQMLLFDSTTEHTPVVAPAVVPTVTKPIANAPARQDENHEPGLNHMGDLARSVLLRYDLVAARRARRAAK